MNHTGTRKAATTEKDELISKLSKNMRKLLDTKDTGHRAVKFNPETIETSFYGTQTPGRIKDSFMAEGKKGKPGKSPSHSGPDCGSSVELRGPTPEIVPVLPGNNKPNGRGDTTSSGHVVTSKSGSGENKMGSVPTSSVGSKTGGAGIGHTVKGPQKCKGEVQTSTEVSNRSQNSQGTPQSISGIVKGPLKAKADKSPMKAVNNGATRVEQSPIRSANNGTTRARMDKSPARPSSNSAPRARVDKSPVRPSSNSASNRARVDKSPIRPSSNSGPRARVDKSPIRSASNGAVRARVDKSPVRSANNGQVRARVDRSPMRSVNNGVVKPRVDRSPVRPVSNGTVKGAVKAFSNRVEDLQKGVETPRLSTEPGRGVSESNSTVTPRNSGTGVIKGDKTQVASKMGPSNKGVKQPPNAAATTTKPLTHTEVPLMGVTKPHVNVHTKATPLKPPSGKKPGLATPLAKEMLEASSGGGTGVGMFKTPSPFVMKSRRCTMDEVKDCQATPECFTAVAFETPSTAQKHRWSSGDVDIRGEDGDQCNMTVAVRVRPFQHRELEDADNKCIVSMVDSETTLTTERDTHRFTYDYSFWSSDETGGEFASQLAVYCHLAQPMLGKAFDGYNTCLFAYGQTGSGKSYSIMGHENNPEEVGIIPRFTDELFKRTGIKRNVDTQTTYNIEISYYEIYNEKIHDLLCPSIKDKTGKKPNLKVREHSEFGPYVEGLSTYVVNSYEDIKRWLSVGNKHRATAATCMNEKSSRSHSVFTVILTQNKVDIIDGQTHEHAITSKVNLVDLAGSERQSLAKTSGDRLREGSNINKSLHTLGKVISVLAEQSSLSHSSKRKKYIPYRDSVLTWLLKESVGGNSKTAMLATISPSAVHAEETLSTLKYANQAKQIVNKVRVNEDPKARLIRELKAEIERLRLSKEGDEVPAGSYAEVASLKEKLMLKELEMQEMTKTWQEKMKRSEQKQMEEARVLEKSGVAFTVDNKLPNLVNLNEDPQLSEVLLYVLKPGQTRVGQTSEMSTADIQLSGALIADNHCTLCNHGDEVAITPVGDASTYVNGNLITAETRLHHGDRVIIGGDHYFRLNYPVEVQNRRSCDVQLPAQPRDFEYARQELSRVQNEKLEEELEDARKQQEEMQDQLEKQQQVIDQVKEEANLRVEEQKEQLEKQKNQFEDRMRELERKLTEEKENKSESQAEVIQKLELEKLMLEQEVTSNRKRMEMEAKAQQKAVENYQPFKSSILDLLSNYRDKIRTEVERHEAIRDQMNTPVVTKAPAPMALPSRHSRKDLYKNMLFVREASKISQLLKKNTSFAIEEQQLPESKEVQTLVKVTNTKLGVSTYWTMDKFEDNLVKMRELYEGDTENLGMDEDDVFYDPSDTWEKDERLDTSVGLSPKLWNSVRLQGSPKVSRGSMSNDIRRTLKLSSTASSTVSQLKSCDLSVCEEAAVGGQCVLNLFRDSLSASVREFRNATFKKSFADQVLNQCDVLKCALTQILDTYNKTEGEKDSLLDSPDILACLRQLDAGLSSLQLVASLWVSQYNSLDSGLVRELLDSIVTTVKKLGKHMDLFLQGVDYDINSMVQEASAQAFESLFILCRCCGELALATETTMVTLASASNTEESQLGEVVDLRQYFLRGCDRFVDKTLQGGLKTVEDCEVKVIELTDALNISGHTAAPEDELLRQVEVAVCSCKVLVDKLQHIQVELDSTNNSVIRDSLLQCNQSPKTSDFYQQSYNRNQALIGHISNLADGVSLTTQAALQLITGTGESSLRRLYRCTEMVQKATSQILSCSLSQTDTALTQDNTSTENSVLSDTQLEQLDIAGQELQFSMSTLGVLVKRRLQTVSSSGKSARVLPLSPSSGSMQKSPSKHSKQHNHNLQLVDLAESVRL